LALLPSGVMRWRTAACLPRKASSAGCSTSPCRRSACPCCAWGRRWRSKPTSASHFGKSGTADSSPDFAKNSSCFQIHYSDSRRLPKCPRFLCSYSLSGGYSKGKLGYGGGEGLTDRNFVIGAVGCLCVIDKVGTRVGISNVLILRFKFNSQYSN
jgi:hypothetical protein